MQRMPQSPTTGGPATEPLPSLTAALQAGRVAYRVPGADKASVLRALVARLELPPTIDRDVVYELLLAREALGSTGVGDGIAVPHVGRPLVPEVPRCTATVCFLERPIEFQALDGKPVHTLFTILCPSVRTHLHLLSRLGFVLQDKQFKAALAGQATAERLLELLGRAESSIVGGAAAARRPVP